MRQWKCQNQLAMVLKRVSYIQQNCIFGIKCKNLFFFLQIMTNLSLALFSFTKYNSEKPENKL